MIETLLIIFAFLFLFSPAMAGPSSTNFELQNYSFGSGGTTTGFSSANFGLFGIAGLTESNPNNGLIYSLQSPVPSAPTLSNNDSRYYDKLHLTINFSISYGSIPNDILFAIAVSTDNFSSDIKYVQADHTLNTNPVWQTYTNWGGASGFNILGLAKDTIYYAKVASRQGNYTQSPYGPVSSLPTAENNTLSFNLVTSSLNLGELTPGNVTVSPTEAEINLTTNSNSGALIYIVGTNSGLKSSQAGNYTINTVDAYEDLSGLSQGYGLRATSTTQSSGLLVIEKPYDGNGNILGPVDTQKRILFTTNSQAVDSGVGKFEIRAKSSLSTPPASDYSDTITIIAAGTF